MTKPPHPALFPAGPTPRPEPDLRVPRTWTWKKSRGIVISGWEKGLEVVALLEPVSRSHRALEGGGQKRVPGPVKAHGSGAVSQQLPGLPNRPLLHLFPSSLGHTIFSERKSFCGSW